MGLITAAFLLSTMLFTTAQVKAVGAVSLATPYVTVVVTGVGGYTITAQAPAWKFGGNIGQTLSNIVVNSGSDTIGSYQETDFSYQDLSGASRSGGIRAYISKPIVLFIDNYLSTASNSSPFPHLSTYPKGLYHLTYNGAFAHPSFINYGADSPWMYFDNAANAYMLSPASDFMLANTTRWSDGSMSSGITSAITTLPQGFTHKTFLVNRGSIISLGYGDRQ